MATPQTNAGGLWCAEVLERLAAYVDGTIAEADKKAVEAHVGQCVQCAKFGQSYSTIIASIREQLSSSVAIDDVSLERIRKRLAL